jgi:elongation factor 1 alpha-like protein
LTGENLVEKIDTPESSWYKDKPTLIESIDTFLPPVRLVEKPFRMSISDVYKVLWSFCF